MKHSITLVTVLLSEHKRDGKDSDSGDVLTFDHYIVQNYDLINIVFCLQSKCVLNELVLSAILFFYVYICIKMLSSLWLLFFFLNRRTLEAY